MIVLRSQTRVAGLRAHEILDFLMQCDDRDYQAWWPGTHLHFRTLEHHPGGLGNIVYMDEMIGPRRIKLTGVITELVPGKKLVWQLKAPVRQPVRLILEVDDDATGVTITHTIRAGFEGLGAVIDPLLRLFFSSAFARDMDAHVKTEFARLGALLGSLSESTAPPGKVQATGAA